MPVTIVDRGWDDMVGRVQRGRGLTSRVGYPSSGDEYPHADVTTLEVAAVHEFGAPNANIPMRSHVRAAYDNNLETLKERAADAWGRVVDGTSTPELEIARLGEAHANDIKQMIQQGPFEPLSPATIARKGSTVPLIDTAQMLQSVTHVEDDREPV